MNDLRKDRRAPASLKVKYRSATVDEFIEQFGSDLSRGGIFIKTKKPLDTGALLKFEFQLQGGVAVIHGVGRVAWRRTEDKARADLPAGMGIKFIKLDDQSRAVIERVEARHGSGSRFEQTEAAELAPPLSSLPPPSTLNGIPTPAAPPPAAAGGQPSARAPFPKRGQAQEPTHDQPTFRPPPPAVSSIPPALADSWPSTAPKAPDRSQPAPRGVLGSAAPDAPVRRSVPSVRSTARDTSEFLASAFSVGGAGHEVRSAARVQVERARRDPQSVDLANELFGDLNESPPKAPAHNSGASPANDSQRVETEAMLDKLGPPSDPKPLTPQERSLSDKIPSMEDLVNEVGSSPEAPLFQRSSSANVAPQPPVPPAASATVIAEPVTGDHAKPLSLTLGNALPIAAGEVTLRPPSNRPQGGSMGMVLGGTGFVAVAALAFFFMRAQHHAGPRSSSPGLEPVATVTATAKPPAATLPPTAAQEQAKPAETALAAKPGPLEISITSEPRGAQVIAAGKPAGNTPATLSLTATVPVEISVQSAGYATKTERITPQAGMPAQHFVLAPLPFELAIKTEPAGATVRVKDARAVSPAPLALGHIDGVVDATIEKDGYQRMSRTVRLEEFREQDGTMRADVTVSLSALPGTAPRRRARAPAAPPPEPPAPESATLAPPVMQVKPEPSVDEAAADKKPSEAAPAHEAAPSALPNKPEPAPVPAPAAPPAPTP